MEAAKETKFGTKVA